MSFKLARAKCGERERAERSGNILDGTVIYCSAALVSTMRKLASWLEGQQCTEQSSSVKTDHSYPVEAQHSQRHPAYQGEFTLVITMIN